MQSLRTWIPRSLFREGTWWRTSLKWGKKSKEEQIWDLGDKAGNVWEVNESPKKLRKRNPSRHRRQSPHPGVAQRILGDFRRKVHIAWCVWMYLGDTHTTRDNYLEGWINDKHIDKKWSQLYPGKTSCCVWKDNTGYCMAQPWVAFISSSYRHWALHKNYVAVLERWWDVGVLHQKRAPFTS